MYKIACSLISVMYFKEVSDGNNMSIPKHTADWKPRGFHGNHVISKKTCSLFKPLEVSNWNSPHLGARTYGNCSFFMEFETTWFPDPWKSRDYQTHISGLLRSCIFMNVQPSHVVKVNTKFDFLKITKSPSQW